MHPTSDLGQNPFSVVSDPINQSPHKSMALDDMTPIVNIEMAKDGAEWWGSKYELNPT